MSFKIWFMATRPFSFTASATPVLMGTAYAFYQTGHIDVILFLFALFGGIFLHAGTNLINDYYDYIKGVDCEGSLGGSRLLVEKKITPKAALVAGYIAFALAFLIGIYLLYRCGWQIVLFGSLGILGGILYSATKLGYKYLALGEYFVFLLMGPLMVLGSHFVQLGHIDWNAFIISIPIGFLVAAILFANNIRDILDDTSKGFQTIASLIGKSSARIVYVLILAFAYLILIFLWLIHLIPVWTLIVFLSIPASLKVARIILDSMDRQKEHLAGVDVLTAQLHFQFGLLMTVGIVLGHFFNFGI